MVLVHDGIEIRIETFDGINGWTANFQVADGPVHPLGDRRCATKEEASDEALSRARRQNQP